MQWYMKGGGGGDTATAARFPSKHKDGITDSAHF